MRQGNTRTRRKVSSETQKKPEREIMMTGRRETEEAICPIFLLFHPFFARGVSPVIEIIHLEC